MHYIDNKAFYSAIVQYKKDLRKAKRLKQPIPKTCMSEYLGDCILQIATHLAFKPNFINYSYRDEMISDAIENCLTYFDNFDEKKYSNPFAYFTQICYYAFIRRIQREKKQQVTKMRYVENLDISDLVVMKGDNQAYAASIIENMKSFLEQETIFQTADMPPDTKSKMVRRPKYFQEEVEEEKDVETV